MSLLAVFFVVVVVNLLLCTKTLACPDVRPVVAQLEGQGLPESFPAQHPPVSEQRQLQHERVEPPLTF